MGAKWRRFQYGQLETTDGDGHFTRRGDQTSITLKRFYRATVESWTARSSNQSILKEISPEYSLEGLMLKRQCFGHLIRRTDSFEKTLMLGKIEGGRKRGRQDEIVGWHHQLDGHKFEQALGAGGGQGSLACSSPWGHKESDTTERLK